MAGCFRKLHTLRSARLAAERLHDPFDDDQRNGRPRFPHGKPVHPDITLHWEAGNPLALLGGTTVYTDKIEIDAGEVDWPLDYAVIPRHSAISFAIAAEGQAAEGGKAVDIVHGRIVNVDIDVDANYDGKIDDADEPLEENPGGYVCVCTNKLTPIKLTLQPAGLPGKLTLSATMGGQRIRVWRNANRTGQIDLTKQGNVVPGTLYVEGVAPSATARDVELRLEYDENPPGQNNSLFKCEDRVRLTVIKVETIKFRIGTASEWKDFAKPQKILLGKVSHLRAMDIQPPGVALPSGFPAWQGTYGVTASGIEVTHTYSGAPSASDADTKTVTTEGGPAAPEEFLVCTKVLGIHSNVDPDAGFTSGHAWVSVTDYSYGSPVTTTYGLWPDAHPNVPDNGPDSDVRIGLEPATGLHNRFFLLSPSQYNAFVTFRQSHAEWSYIYTCANWAEDAYRAGTAETVDSSDNVLFGTPRKISASIVVLETDNPTTSDMPFEGGEDASSSSSGSSWGGSSFT
jgi:hypothetical protein